MDLFEKEQRVYEDAFNLVNEAKNGAQISFEFFETLAKEYGKLLRHVRRVTKISDKNTIDLFANNVDLKNKVHYDSLTGLFNRRYLEDMLKQNIRELSRSDRVLSLLMLDVDFFKKFNDTYGHNEGDNCLRSIAETLSQCVFREMISRRVTAARNLLSFCLTRRKKARVLRRIECFSQSEAEVFQTKKAKLAVLLRFPSGLQQLK